jgi:hypothetical protein
LPNFQQAIGRTCLPIQSSSGCRRGEVGQGVNPGTERLTRAFYETSLREASAAKGRLYDRLVRSTRRASYHRCSRLIRLLSSLRNHGEGEPLSGIHRYRYSALGGGQRSGTPYSLFAANLVLNARTHFQNQQNLTDVRLDTAWPGRTVRTFKPFLLASRGPGMTKNASPFTALEAVSQAPSWLLPILRCNIPSLRAKSVSH